MKIGLLGGTFDPVHNAHLFIAEAARLDLGLDRILFLPTNTPPHRADAPASCLHRLAMLRGAIAANPFFAIDESDLEPASSGYTADLLPKLRRHMPDHHLTFIVGGDSLLDSPWQRFDSVLSYLDTFAIAPRAEKGLERLNAFLASLEPSAQAKIRILTLPTLSVSATGIRTQIARGGSIRYLVPDFVARYVDEKGLYRK